MEEPRKPLRGNTYPVREKIKALGGTWNGAMKAWMMPESRFEEAQKLVQAAPAKDTGWNRGRHVGWLPCGYPGCHWDFCEECDGKGLDPRHRYTMDRDYEPDYG
jgi:hypothetical protein